MNRKVAWLACLLGAFLALPAVFAQNPAHRPVLMISIDGMRPDYVLEADKHNLKIPVLRSILRDGAHATDVVPVLPTMTYPNHTTLVTGVWPIVHGVENNTLYDPLGKNDGGWNWYGRIVKVKTLWQAAHDAGLSTASIYWPVTVGSHGIDYNIPEYFRSRNDQDRLLEEALSTPVGFLEEIEKTAGLFAISDSGVDFDEVVTKTSVAVIEAKKPDFMTIHIVSLDHNEHGNGPFSPQANAALEQIDGMVGRILAAEKMAHPDADIFIVSDHGFMPISNRFNVNLALANAGLLTVKQGAKPTVKTWKAFAWAAGGTAAIYLQDPKDTATHTAVAQLLEKLKADPKNGIDQILTSDQAKALGGFSEAAFVVSMKSEYSIGGGLKGEVVEPIKPAGTHGFSPTHPEIHSSFFAIGPDIAHGKNLGTLDMRQIAPTVAQVLGVKLPDAVQPVIPIH